MKNTKKLVALFVVLALVLVSIFVLVACTETHECGHKCDICDKCTDDTCTNDVCKDKCEGHVVANGVAYGYVHSNGVGKATVATLDGVITDATLDEACVPTQVKPSEEDVANEANADYIVAGYWKTVKWAGVTAVYDEEAKGYKVGDQLLINKGAEDSYFSLTAEGAANAKIYFEAVANNKVTVATGASKNDATIMTSDNLLKSKNGYWTVDGGLGWKGNVAATLAYVLENGVDGTLTKDEETKIWTDENGIATGATWSDMANYYNILKGAKDNALAVASVITGEHTVTGEIKAEGVRGSNKYQAKVSVTVVDGKITAVTALDLDTDYIWSTNSGYGDKDSVQAFLDEFVVGQDVETVLGWTVDINAQSANALINGATFHYTKDGAEKETSATETGARVIAAVQVALMSIAD